MNIPNKLSLSSVIMPLVRLLDTKELSWDDREKIAAAIRETHEHWTSMEKEHLHSSQVAAQGYGQQGIAAAPGQWQAGQIGGQVLLDTLPGYPQR